MRLATTANAQQVADQLGYPASLVMQRAREFGVPWTDGPESATGVGEPLFTIEHAVDLVERCRAHDEEHTRRWREYQAYLADKAAKARDERNEDIAKARAESRRRSLRFAAEDRERREREAMQAAAQESDRRAQREGNPMSFARFVKRRA